MLCWHCASNCTILFIQIIYSHRLTIPDLHLTASLKLGKREWGKPKAVVLSLSSLVIYSSPSHVIDRSVSVLMIT